MTSSTGGKETSSKLLFVDSDSLQGLRVLLPLLKQEITVSGGLIYSEGRRFRVIDGVEKV